jgi:ornithine cyclodeaminase/alanine dehydrogenase
MNHPPYLTEADVARLVTVGDAIAVLEQAFATWHDAGTTNLPRQRALLATGNFHLIGASYGLKGVYGLKAYFGGKGGARYHTILYAADGGAMLAMIEADLFGQLRTGAASGLATKLLANPTARTLAIIGTGKQARAQALAVCAVRPIAQVRVFGRTNERRTDFARALEAELKIETRPADTAQACVEGGDVVVTITKSAEPVCRSEWLADGVHVNAAGANSADRREVDPATVLRAAVRATDDRKQAREEAAEFRDLVGAGRLSWDDVQELGDLVTGKVPGRTSPSAVTLFKSLGIGLEDVAFAELIHRRAPLMAIHQSSSSLSGTSPKARITTASEKSPIIGLPLRLKAIAPAFAGSRDIAPARLRAWASLWHSIA